MPRRWSSVNRIAQVLTEDFGLQPGNRVLLRGGNSIGMALAWLGVVQAGLVAVATMPLLRAKELGEIIEKARPALALCDAACWRNCRPRRRKAHAARHRALQRCGRAGLAGRAVGAEGRQVHALPGGGRRHRADGLYLRHHRQAQGGRAHAPRRAGRLRGLAAPRAQGQARRHRGRLAAAGLYLRPGRHADFPDVGGRFGVLPVDRLHAGGHGQADQPGGRDRLLHRAHVLPADGRLLPQHGVPKPAHVRERRRKPAGCHAPAVEGRHRHRDD
jgi:hypothetical protein